MDLAQNTVMSAVLFCMNRFSHCHDASSSPNREYAERGLYFVLQIVGGRSVCDQWAYSELLCTELTGQAIIVIVIVMMRDSRNFPLWFAML